jgi:uncharacterized membrane protein
MNLTKRLKSYFLRGVAVLLPALLTLWILAWGYGQVRDRVAVHINKGVVKALVWSQHDRLSKEDLEDYQAKQTDRFVKGNAGSIVGVLIAIVIIFLVGALLASVVGRTLWRIIESFILNTPVLRRVYPYVKQVTDFLLTQEEQRKVFSRVVAVEYPRKGIWSIGFVTGSGLRAVVKESEQEFLTVMIPTSPTPVTGWVITVPKEETIALDMTLEEAIRFIVSAGVILPDGQRPITPPACAPDEKRSGNAVVFG